MHRFWAAIFSMRLREISLKLNRLTPKFLSTSWKKPLKKIPRIIETLLLQEATHAVSYVISKVSRVFASYLIIMYIMRTQSIKRFIYLHHSASLKFIALLSCRAPSFLLLSNYALSRGFEHPPSRLICLCFLGAPILPRVGLNVLLSNHKSTQYWQKNNTFLVLEVLWCALLFDRFFSICFFQKCDFPCYWIWVFFIFVNRILIVDSCTKKCLQIMMTRIVTCIQCTHTCS